MVSPAVLASSYLLILKVGRESGIQVSFFGVWCNEFTEPHCVKSGCSCMLAPAFPLVRLQMSPSLLSSSSCRRWYFWNGKHKYSVSTPTWLLKLVLHGREDVGMRLHKCYSLMRHVLCGGSLQYFNPDNACVNQARGCLELLCISCDLAPCACPLVCQGFLRIRSLD